MTLQLFGHPFSAYTQKVTIAFYETNTPVTPRVLSPEDPATAQEFAALWPIRKFPLLLIDGARTLMESSVIIEYLAIRCPAAGLLPTDADSANEVRMLDRFFDHYVMTPVQKIVGDRLRPDGAHDPHGVLDAHSTLDTAYAWLNDTIGARVWVCGNGFSLADCAAAPALFYADWVHPIDDAAYSAVRNYRQRLLMRPSVMRVVDEARAYRPLFPGGAPDQD
jgi:glutathione S-transferase